MTDGIFTQIFKSWVNFKNYNLKNTLTFAHKLGILQMEVVATLLVVQNLLDKSLLSTIKTTQAALKR